MENLQNTPRTSKLSVFIFIISLCAILGTIVGGFSYNMGIVAWVTAIIGSVFFIWLAWFIKRRAVKKSLRGVKIARFAFYTFIIIAVVDIAGALCLVRYANSLKSFAVQTTPALFANNLEGMKANATDDLKKVLSYDSETADTVKKFEEVGSIKECLQEKNDIIQVTWGPYLDFGTPKIGLKGTYTVRCYGENKPFDFIAATEYKSGHWMIDNYQFRLELGKEFNVETSLENK